jgi:hypothetical protein
MKYFTRHHGSQRPSTTEDMSFKPNFAGQGGNPYLVLRTGNKYHIIHFETAEEVKELLSQAHIIHHNWRPS